MELVIKSAVGFYIDIILLKIPITQLFLRFGMLILHHMEIITDTLPQSAIEVVFLCVKLSQQVILDPYFNNKTLEHKRFLFGSITHLHM